MELKPKFFLNGEKKIEKGECVSACFLQKRFKII